MFFLSKNISLNGIPVEDLAEKFFDEYGVFESYFTDYTSKDLILKVFNQLFEKKYLKTNFIGKKRWEI